MKKKKVLSLAIAVAMALSLAGCGDDAAGSGSGSSAEPSGSGEANESGGAGETESSEGSEEAASSGDAVTVEVWSNNRHDEEYMTRMVEEFNSTHTDLQINYTIMADDWLNSIQLAYQANTAPDVMAISSSDGLKLSEWVGAGMLESLTSYIEASADFNTVTEALDHKYDYLNSIGDDIYWVPTGVRSGTRIEYNIGLLQEAGYDAVPSTLAEMVEAADKITENGGGSYYGVGFTQNGFGRWLEGIGEMSGLNHMGYDYKAGKFDFSGWAELLKLANQFVANGDVLPGSDTQGVDNNRALFAAGSFCFWGNASQEAGVFTEQFPCAFDWGVAELPTMEGTVKGALSCTPNFGWGMLSTAKDKEAAWKVIEYFGSEEFLKGYFEGGYSAPLGSYMAGKIDTSKVGRLGDFALQDYEDVYPSVPTVTVDGDDYAVTMWNVVLGNLDADEAVADLTTRYNDALERGIQQGSCQRITIADFDNLHPSAGTAVYGE